MCHEVKISARPVAVPVSPTGGPARSVQTDCLWPSSPFLSPCFQSEMFQERLSASTEHKHAYAQPFRHLPSPPSPPSHPARHHQHKKGRQKTERMEVEGGMLSSRNAIFCLQPKGGVSQKSDRVPHPFSPSWVLSAPPGHDGRADTLIL